MSQKVAGTANDEAPSNSDNLTSAIMFLSEDVDIDYAENYFHFWLLIKESGLDGTMWIALLYCLLPGSAQ